MPSKSHSFVPVDSAEELPSEYGGGEGEGAADVFTILPPDFGETDLVDFEPILLAQARIEQLDTTKEVAEEINVVIVEEVEDQVVEMMGTKCNLGFAMSPPVAMPYLVMYVKTMREVCRLRNSGPRYCR